ncbi:MAG: AAA family ATPase [Gemmatimonadota bacterium]|nr:AAA family ATPase [Gemmatimonadota bacterium]MDE2953953.1 AAA family ATPase [Gemmatimonadota bacterium]
MATSQDRNLTLKVKDFGPIYSAEVELRPLTVFVGPSNTGKSYLAILIYALHKFFNSHKREKPSYFYHSSYSSSSSLINESVISEKNIMHLIDEADKIVSQVNGDSLIPLTDEITSLIRALFSNFLPDDDLAGEIMRCFGIDETRRLIRHGSKKSTEVALSSKMSDLPEAAYNYNELYKFAIKKESFTATIPNTAPLQTGKDAIEKYIQATFEIKMGSGQKRAHNKERNYFVTELIDGLSEIIASYFANPISQPAHYLPADRTGVMHAHKVVVGSLVQGASRAGLYPTRALPVLSGVVADFIEQLLELGDLSSGGKRLNENLTQRLEKEILRGAIRIENSVTGYPVFSYQPTGWKEDMQLMNTSSMVSELAPVVLYLRHVVSPGEVLIIEEPESHLHPGMQVEFIRHLAAAVRSGIRIIITTHSEWVLEELANLVRLSELSESDRNGIGGADYALSPDQVGTWLFEPKKRPRGSIVKEIPLDVDYGGFRSDYDDVAIGTHNDWATIGNRIVEREHE